MTNVVERPRQETLTRPPRQWRNWWDVKRKTTCNITGAIVNPGIQPGRCAHPSKEVAEQKAIDDMAWNAANAIKPVPEYLGAYPEGETP